MANPFAGEVSLKIDGQAYDLKLTLGSLVELEMQLSTPSLLALVGRFETGKFTAADLLALLVAGLRGGGHGLCASDLAHAEIEGGVAEAARVAARLLARSFALPGRQGSQT